MRQALPYVIAAVVAAILIAGIVFFIVVVRPWVAMPDEPRERIEARFAKVEALAALPEHCRADRSLLLEAIDALQSADVDVVEIVWPRDAAGDAPEVIPWRNPDGLPPELQRAIESARAWHAGAGGLGDDPCDDELDQLTALVLGELTLATAMDRPDDPQLTTTLRLAAQLRTCRSVIGAMVGTVLTRRAVEWAEDRRVPPDNTFESYRPSAAEVLPLLAREAVCGVSLVEGAFHDTGIDRLRTRDQPWYVAEDTTLEREVLMLKQHYADLIERASKARGDLDAMAKAVELAEPEELPPSLVVRAMQVNFTQAIGTIAKDIAAYDSYLDRRRKN